jgi:hypothetical protein
MSCEEWMGEALDYSIPYDPYDGLTLDDVLTDEEKEERAEYLRYKALSSWD